MHEIIPSNNHGCIQIKFSLAGKRYSFNPIKGGSYTSQRDLAKAKAICLSIQNDIIAGYFDPTLRRYKANPVEHVKGACLPGSAKADLLLPIWDAWVDTLSLSPATKADHYEMIRRMIVKNNALVNNSTWFTSSAIAASTFNKRLGYLKRCLIWAEAEGLITSKPFSKLKSKKTNKAEIKPFTLKEIKQILERFASRYPHYLPFVQFMFLIGVSKTDLIILLTIA